MKLRKISLIWVVAMLCFGASYAQTAAQLNLKKGQKYLVENKSATVSTTQLPGQAMEVTIDGTTLFEIEVTDIKDGNYHLTSKITGATMKVKQMGQEMTFDSEKEEDMSGPLGGLMKDVLNVPQNMVLSRQGKLVSTSGTDDIDPQLKQFESMGFGAAIAFQAIPSQIKAGQTWTDNNIEEVSGTTKNTIFTVKSVSGSLANIALKGDIDVKSQITNMGMEMAVKTKGTFQGEETVDKSTGVIQSQRVDTTTDGTIEVMGQELPMSTKITTDTKVRAL